MFVHFISVVLIYVAIILIATNRSCMIININRPSSQYVYEILNVQSTTAVYNLLNICMSGEMGHFFKWLSHDFSHNYIVVVNYFLCMPGYFHRIPALSFKPLSSVHVSFMPRLYYPTSINICA